jgi:hypothetical protein
MIASPVNASVLSADFATGDSTKFDITVLDEQKLTCAISRPTTQTANYTFAETSSDTFILPEEVSTTVSGSAATFKIVEIGANTFEESLSTTTKSFNKKLQLSTNLTTIGEDAFHNSGIKGLIFPTASQLKTIGNYAFDTCTDLAGTLEFPSQLLSIGICAFVNCHKLGTGVVSIDDKDSVVLPNAINWIGDGAFGTCENIEGNIDLHQLSYLGQGAFASCAKLSTVSMVDTNMTEIFPNTFNNCVGLERSPIFPPTIKKIGLNAFHNCSGMVGELHLPKYLEEIGEYAFQGCTGFVGDLVLSKNLKRIMKDAFQGCTGLNGKLQMYDQISYIDYDAFNDLPFITSIVLN